VAALAVFLYHSDTSLFDLYYLRLGPHGENGGMPESVLSLKQIVVKKIIMWHMAVVAGSYLPVGTVLPGGILWSHYMTVNTGFRIIRQVRMCPGDIKQVGCHAHKDS
jgi:hypothetical protein